MEVFTDAVSQAGVYKSVRRVERTGRLSIQEQGRDNQPYIFAVNAIIIPEQAGTVHNDLPNGGIALHGYSGVAIADGSLVGQNNIDGSCVVWIAIKDADHAIFYYTTVHPADPVPIHNNRRL